ncbi:hypothetical protein [Nocardia sp. NPDC051570]|uniref:hypothetical protein n=1 Tax=Nocardia sp. NPDC051570 TaxID=3364324 RepID=UPI0037A2A4DA
MNTNQPCRFGPGACPASRIGLVSIDDGCVVPMICHLLPEGNVIVPAASGHALVEGVVGHTVRIEFGSCGSADCAPWAVSSVDRAVHVVAIEHRRWYLRSDVLIAAGSGNSPVGEHVSTDSSASHSVSARWIG